MLAVLLAVGVALAGGPWTVAYAAGTPLRQVDWRAVLANDPSITIDPDAYQLPNGNPPYISLAAPGPNGDTLAGYALVDDVLYADLDGDGAEEAVINVDSGGTGGLFGFLLYRDGTPSPNRVLVYTGYKIGTQIQDGRLIIYEPNYVGFEANCCPSSITRTVNSLSGDNLVMLTSEVQPNDVQEPTVWAFYQALSEKRYEDAYDFFSPAFKANNPFERWRAGYATTQRIEVDTKAGATPSEVLIDLRSTDQQPGGGTVTRRFRGAWTVVWSADQKRWLLDTAMIEQVS